MDLIFVLRASQKAAVLGETALGRDERAEAPRSGKVLSGIEDRGDPPKRDINRERLAAENETARAVTGGVEAREQFGGKPCSEQVSMAAAESATVRALDGAAVEDLK